MDRRFILPSDARVCLYRGRIEQNFVALRQSPKSSSALDTELLYGQGFDVFAENGSWLLGRARSLVKGSRRRGYVGYIPRKSFTSEPVKSTHIVTALAAPIFKRPDIKSGVKMALPMNAQIRAAASNDILLELQDGGFIHTTHVRSIGKAVPQDFVDIATRCLGRPYIWGGTGGLGLDCSGLVQMALSACDIDAPRDADQQELHLGQQVDLASVERGDLIFWAGHVGIMQTKTRLLHANAHHMAVAQEPLKKATQRIGPPRSIKRLSGLL